MSGVAELLRVGLTGGIGAGKSEVSRRLAAQGAVVIDADAVAREVVAPGTPGSPRSSRPSARACCVPDGSLDRARLGEIVFADPELRAKLNAIVHPRSARGWGAGAGGRNRPRIVVHDVPLIAENNLADDLRRGRGRGRAAADPAGPAGAAPRHDPEQAEARMAAQASREERLAIAGIVIDNSGSLAELDRQVGDLWTELQPDALSLPSSDPAGCRTAPGRHEQSRRCRAAGPDPVGPRSYSGKGG